MKQPGFMLLETIIALSALALLGLFSIQIITTYATRVRELSAEHEVLIEAKKHIDQQLLFPLKKNTPQLFFKNQKISLKTQFLEIQPKSSLKPFKSVLKLLCIDGQKENKEARTKLVAFIITPPNKEAQAA